MAGSILETFYILFRSNADQVRDSTRTAQNSTNQLERTLADTDVRTQQVGEGFANMVGAAKKALISVLAVSAAVASTKAAIGYVEGIRMTSLAIGESTENIDAWGRSTKKFGGDAETFQGTLKSLNTSIRETAFTGDGAMSPMLRRLGLNLRDLSGNIKTPLQLLPEIADAFKRISPAEATHLGNQLGLDQATIMLLLQGRKGVEDLVAQQKRYGVVTAEDAELTKKFTMQMNDLSSVWGSISRGIALESVPAITWFFEKLKVLGEFISDHKTLMQGAFIAVAAVLTTLYLPAMISVAAATLAATWPILLIVAAVAALAAAFAFAYDEVVNFMEGNDSLLGEAVKKWPVLGGIIKVIGEQIRVLANIAKWAAGFLSAMFTDPEAARDEMFKGIEGIIDYFTSEWPILGEGVQELQSYFSELGDSVTGVFKGIWEYFESLVDRIKAGIKSITNGIDTAKHFLGISSDTSGTAMEQAQSSIDLASTTPLASQSSSSINNSVTRGNKNTNVDVGEVVIQLAPDSDAEGISAAVGLHLTSQMRQAMYNFDDGVSA
jgi:phage-related protein